jgi:cell division septation protein DedD
VQEVLGLIDASPRSKAESQTPVTKETQMSFYQGIKDNEPPQPKPKPRPRPKAKVPEKPKSVEKKKPAPKEAPPAVAKPAAKAKPEAAAPARGWVVQVTSLKDQNMALKLMRSLKSGGFNAYVLRSQVRNLGIRFRVRVGPYGTRQSADVAALRIKTRFKHVALVMQEE